MNLQIDVKGPIDNAPNLIECLLIVDGYNYRIYMSDANYNDLKDIGFFLRDGSVPDSANIVNTTETYTIKK